MKLGTIRSKTGRWTPAAFIAQGVVDLPAAAALAPREIGAVLSVDHQDPVWIGSANHPALQQLVDWHISRNPILPLEEVEIGPPIARPGKIIAVGRNYLDHVREGQRIWEERGKIVDKPKRPAGFIKVASALSHHEAPIIVPSWAHDVDYEVELAIVIGERASNVDPSDAMAHIAGYTICNDLATRPVQFEEMEQQIGIVMGKNLPGFAPMGPWMVTSDEIRDPQNLDIGLRVNGEVRQSGNTRDMLFGIAELVAYWSRLGLEIGDVILTGTPAGVAAARPPDQRADFYLKDGDIVEAWVSRVGTLQNKVAFEIVKPSGPGG